MAVRLPARPRSKTIYWQANANTGGSPKGGFQKGGFGGCSPEPQNRNEGTKNGTTVPKTGMRAQKQERLYKTLERGRIRQNQPKLQNRPYVSSRFGIEFGGIFRLSCHLPGQFWPPPAILRAFSGAFPIPIL